MAKYDPKIFTEAFNKVKISKPLLEFSKPKLLPEQKVDKVQMALEEARIKHQKKIKLKNNPLSQLEKLSISMNNKAIRALTENFDYKKQRLLEELREVCDKSVIARIEKADTPEKLAKILVKQDMVYYETWLKQILKGSAKFNKDKTLSKTSLQMEQILFEANVKRAKFVLARERALHIPSQNPQVIAIENALKEKYGVKFVSLKDNETLARNVLKACETASKDGVEISENIIVSDFLFPCGEHIYSPNKSVVLLNPKQIISPGRASTNAEYHAFLHEILHGKQAHLAAFNFKKIPKEFIPVKQNLSEYSASKGTHETFIELYTKKCVDGLNPEEERLFNYLNILG
ncbi:hypothetical protein J6P92_08550 [bacterium]|nr:hypothetical protein [bacterium]